MIEPNEEQEKKQIHNQPTKLNFEQSPIPNFEVIENKLLDSIHYFLKIRRLHIFIQVKEIPYLTSTITTILSCYFHTTYYKHGKQCKNHANNKFIPYRE